MTKQEFVDAVAASSGLSKDEIDKMVKDASAHADEDRKKREAVDARNQLDGLIYQTEKTLADNKAPRDLRIAIRGDVNNRGELAPRHLPSILCEGAPPAFREGVRAFVVEADAPHGNDRLAAMVQIIH